MSTRSPSDFLAFYRYACHYRPSRLPSRIQQHRYQARCHMAPLSTSSRTHAAQEKDSSKKEVGGAAKKQHVIDKDNHYDIQSSASKTGREERQNHGDGKSDATGNASQATTDRDHGKFNTQAKKDFPEAPEPVIGMNDERGGKGR